MNREDLLRSACEAIQREDAETAIRLLKPLAERGDVEAQYRLGSSYSSPVHLLGEIESLDWLRKAVSQGHPEATYELAQYLGEGCYGPPADEEHVQLMIRAGELGCVEAQRDLGALFATGDWAGAHDPGAARHWYRRAAEQGHADAQYNLSAMLLDGEGGDVDVVEGLRWLRQAAAQDEIMALRQLGDAYERGWYGLPVDAARARELHAREDAVLDRWRDEQRKETEDD